MNILTAPRITPLRAETLDDLWREAETLGNVRIWTHASGIGNGGPRRGYTVTICGRKRNTEMEVKREHTSLLCAMADAINEAREMGLGEPA